MLALYDAALPGAGSVAERLQVWRKRYELVPDKSGLLATLLQRALAEVRQRTAAFVQLPVGEEVEVQTVTGLPTLGEHRYLGNYRSRIEVNADVPTHLAGLLDFLCYEGYPGHHTEFVLKEQRLYRDRGYLEQSIAPIISPQAVISEGIATLASELNFAPGEEAHWLAGYVYPEAGVEPEVVDLVKLH